MIFILCGLVFLWLIFSLYEALFLKRKYKASSKLEVVLDSKVTPEYLKLENQMKKLPTQILRAVTGATNMKKGALGELVGHISLKAEYDRIIPLGTIVDFMCIRFPKGDDIGCVDFVDMKTGGARLSKDQSQLKKLIDGQRIGFKKFSVDVNEIVSLSN